ncbi:MAG: DNA internalization-related competence protein ComEC/Rec2, partial [Thiothrix sp.]
GIGMLYLYPPVGVGLLSLANTGLGWLLDALSYLAMPSNALVYQSITSFWILLLLLLVAAILLAPKGLPGRWLAAFWLLPLFLTKNPVPALGGFRVSFLDVGQGLSVVVQTQKHSLVYDTGAKFSSSFSAAKAVILPFLREQGIGHIDTLVLSHSDSDHAGGAALLRESMPIEKTLSSFELSTPFQQCRAGQHWEWEGVHFRILHPTDALSEIENDQSCVLSIENNQGRVLLTGDISWRSEQALIGRLGSELVSTVLQVPHHGSLTSSAEEFIDSVKPQYAVFNVGYRNRFGFPKHEVVERYRYVGATILRTDREGAVHFEFIAGAKKVSMSTTRLKQHFWQNLSESNFAE